ncbi:hypothetical protein [Haloarchaeobius iranensis]|uniref:DUF8106 domain-containing protein n=1 Tax=Haloarchaeobius iranensis TaxID=996166 RepID=A0A1G9XB66_9EURY|nr:hypothetical protein [Haloarchaeobius iranensis]SDM93917.1 hypothetical protein SAMN05192554_11020 [Haloarchaeobius iranensis]
MSDIRVDAPGDGTRTRRKATLFCGACDHESPVDGDWLRADRAGGTALVCPDCEHTLTVRRSYGPGDDAGDRDAIATLAAAPARIISDYAAAVERAASVWTTGD